MRYILLSVRVFGKKTRMRAFAGAYPCFPMRQNRRVGGGNQYLSSTAPHAKPPPIPSSSRLWPRWICPLWIPASKASGMEAAEVLPWSCTVSMTFSMPKPKCLAVDSMMRLLDLMRNEPIDLVGRHACFPNHFFRHFGQHFDGEFENARTVHFNVRRTADLAVGNLAGNIEQVEIVAVRLQFAVNDAGFVGCAQYYSSGAVAEQHAGCPVAPVENAAERFCADNQNFLCHAAFDIGVGSVEGVHKSCAYGLYVERGTAVGHAEFVLHDGGGGGGTAYRVWRWRR